MSTDSPESRITADRIEIELEAPIFQPRATDTQKLKLYNIPSLAVKLKFWLIVLLSVCSLLSNLCSFASSPGLFTLTNSTTLCTPYVHPLYTLCTPALDALKRIYHNPQDLGSLGGIDRLVRKAKRLQVIRVSRQDVVEYLLSEQAYRYISLLDDTTSGITFTLVVSMLNGRPTWPTCKDFRVRTMVCATYSRWSMCFQNSLG